MHVQKGMKPKSRKDAAMFKLSIRDLFLITTLAAVGVAWWIDHARQAEYRSTMEPRLAAAEAAVASEQAKLRSVAQKLGNLYVDARTACAAHGLYVQGTGKSARLVENDGQDFHRSTNAAPFVVVDGKAD
jgi:hypothetical protein